MKPKVLIVNPSHVAFGVAVITPRWLYVLAAAAGTEWGDPVIIDETLELMDLDTIARGDVVGIGIHTGNARRGYELGHAARERGAWVVYGGIHATLFPDEVLEQGAAHAVVKGDGDLVFKQVVRDCLAGHPQPLYDGGRVSGDDFIPARWDLLPEASYMWASVQTVRGCPKHCSFCSVWRTDGQEPRQRAVDKVVGEIVTLRRLGYRFIAWADDNFYPVSLEDLAMARRRHDPSRLHQLEDMRRERFELMAALAELPEDMVFFTQITMEAAEDTTFLDAMRNARIKGALVGVEAVTPEGLKAVYKDFNLSGDKLVEQLKRFHDHGVHVLGSFIFGLSTDRAQTFDATLAFFNRARGAGHEPATVLLDEFLELRTFESFPGLRRVLHDLVDGLAASSNHFVLSSRYTARTLRLLRNRSARFEVIHMPSFTAEDTIDVLGPPAAFGGGDAHDAEHTARTVQALADGRPAYVRILADELSAMRDRGLPGGGDAVSALAALLAPGGALAKVCGFSYELRLHRARGYGALKAILDILGEEEGLTLTEISHRLQRTPGSTKDYLSWLEDVDLVISRHKRYSYTDPLLRVWVRLHCRAAQPTEEELAREVHRYAMPRLPQPLDPAPEPSLKPALVMAAAGPLLSDDERKDWGIIEID